MVPEAESRGFVSSFRSLLAEAEARASTAEEGLWLIEEKTSQEKQGRDMKSFVFLKKK